MLSHELEARFRADCLGRAIQTCLHEGVPRGVKIPLDEVLRFATAYANFVLGKDDGLQVSD